MVARVAFGRHFYLVRRFTRFPLLTVSRRTPLEMVFRSALARSLDADLLRGLAAFVTFLGEAATILRLVLGVPVALLALGVFRCPFIRYPPSI